MRSDRGATLLMSLAFAACADAADGLADAALPDGGPAGSDGGATAPDAGATDTDGGASAPDAGTLKPLPRGVFESTAGLRTPSDDVVGDRTPDPLTGVMIKVPWDLCDRACLLDTIEGQLDRAHAQGLQASLIVLDALTTPTSILDRCESFEYAFRGAPERLCLPWDPVYQAEKGALLDALGARVDAHPALAYVYFTGACASNGAEGHCRVDEAAFAAAGYTEARLVEAYRALMSAYRAAFPSTPIAFEVHAVFGSAEPWASLWSDVAGSGRVGVAAWWCAERLSLAGWETLPVWPIVQDAATRAFTVCQTVGNFTSQPYRFSDTNLGLDYGTETDWDADDSARAFEDTMGWALESFDVLEPWTQDVRNPTFTERLRDWSR